MKYYHSHIIIPEKCAGSLKCLRACPTEAIRLRHGTITYFDDLCVDCGACINVCPENVFVPMIDEISDFEKFEFKIAIPSRTLYTQFGSAIHPSLVHQALKNIGFDAVIDSSRVCHEMMFAISEHIKTNPKEKPIISSFCPALIRLIQVNYPNLMDLISTFDVPREITAKEAQQEYAEKLGININKIGAIYITPCPAMVVSIKQPAEKEKSWIDGAIGIKDIYNMILPELMIVEKSQKPKSTDDYFYYGRGWGEIGQVSQYLDTERYLSITGIENIKNVLNDIEDSKLQNIDYIEAFTCTQGCIGGVFCVENPYIARHTAIILEKKYGQLESFNEKEILEKYKKQYYFLGRHVLPRPTRALASDIGSSIKRMIQKERILVKLPKKDCALCGAPTCETFAHDCARGEAELSDCIFFKPSTH